MTPERWARIKDVFTSARERPESERSAFLEEACESDLDLRQSVERLLNDDTDLSSPVAGILRDAVPALSAGRVLGRYRVEENLGAGGMGAVYRAYDTDLQRSVAVKLLTEEYRPAPEARKRLLREARAACALSHPNIVAVYEVGSAAGIDFIAMEFVDGEPLHRLIPSGGLPLQTALALAAQIADALAAAHACGIIHRDLKPQNVMVTGGRSTRAGVVKLLDFGLAKLVTPLADGGTSLTSAGEVFGTPAYMSPEQAEGKPVDARSDVFSFGALLYEMLTGRRAFAGDSTAAILSAILRVDPPPLHGVPEELEKLVSRCLRKDPARRMQHMDDVRLILEDLRDVSGAPATAARPSRSVRRSKVLAVAALAVTLFAAGTAAWSIRRARLGDGALRLLTLTSYPGMETSPTFSPDGKQVAFSWNGEKQDNFDIYVALAGSGAPPLRLTAGAPNDVSPVWSPDGRQIAFVRLDGHRAGIYVISPLAGQERKLSDFAAPALEPDQSKWTSSWSPDGKWLAFPDEGTQGEAGVFALSVTTGEKRRLTSNRLDFDYSPAFSPDGHALAYASCQDTYSCDVFVLELSPDYLPAAKPRRVSRQGAYVGGIAWTQDADALVYEASEDAGINPYLWRIAATGPGVAERVELAGRPARQPAIARGGRRLAFSRGGQDLDIWKYDAGGGMSSFASSTLYEFNPAYSPDGSRIAFSSTRSGQNEIWVADPDGSRLVQLTDGPGKHQGGPQWSPDGRQIAFSSQAEDGAWAIYRLDSAGGQPHRVTPRDISANTTSWSRDGQWLYFASNRTGRLEISRIPAAGGEIVPVTDAGGFIGFESWDGKTLYYTKSRGSGSTPVFARPLPAGPERIAVESAVNDAFAVARGGLFYFARDRAGGFALQFLDTASGKVRTLSTTEATPHWRIAVSPDGQTVLFGAAKPANADLVLIEGYR